MRRFEAEIEQRGMRLANFPGGLKALRMETADFFEVAIDSGNLVARYLFPEWAVKEWDPVITANSCIAGNYNHGKALADWAWENIPRYSREVPETA